MRMLVLEKDWWTDQEVVSILDYCTGDVSATSRLLTRMVPEIDWPRALLRGRYMLAVAQMEHTGIPTDLPLLKELQKQWNDLKVKLIAAVDAYYGVYEGSPQSEAVRPRVTTPRHSVATL